MTDEFYEGDYVKMELGERYGTVVRIRKGVLSTYYLVQFDSLMEPIEVHGNHLKKVNKHFNNNPDHFREGL